MLHDYDIGGALNSPSYMKTVCELLANSGDALLIESAINAFAAEMYERGINDAISNLHVLQRSATSGRRVADEKLMQYQENKNE